MSEACNAPAEYEVGGYYWITLTTAGQISDQFVYLGPSYNNSTYHVLQARHNKNKLVTLSNTQMERYAERMYDRPKKGEIWSREAPSIFSGGLVRIHDVANDWVMYWRWQGGQQPKDGYTGFSYNAMTIKDFTKRYKLSEEAE